MSALEGPASVARPRVISFLISEEWANDLDTRGFDVDYVLCWGHALWQWSKSPMPSGARFVADIILRNYRAAVVPIGDCPKNPVDTEMLEKFLNLEKVSGLRSFCISTGHTLSGDVHCAKRQKELGLRTQVFHSISPEDVSGLPQVAGAYSRIKTRWRLATHPGWMRHCHFITEMLLDEKEKEPEGSLVDLDAGDGCLTRFVQQRFGKLDVQGFCNRPEEKEAGKRVDPSLPLSIEHDLGAIREYDYVVSADVDLAMLPKLKETIDRCCKKKAIITIRKEGVDLPTPFALISDFPNWRLIEMPSHYALVKTCE